MFSSPFRTLDSATRALALDAHALRMLVHLLFLYGLPSSPVATENITVRTVGTDALEAGPIHIEKFRKAVPVKSLSFPVPSRVTAIYSF